MPERGRFQFPSARLVIGGSIALAVVAFIVWIFASSVTAGDYSCAELLTAPPGASGADGFATEALGSRHVAVGTKISYGFCPPTSGSHYNATGRGPFRPGFYGPGTDAGPGGWVHNLEHGYVVALYRCADGTCPSEAALAALRAFAANGPPSQSAAACGYRSKVLVARFDQMSTAFSLVAWDRALLLDAFDPAVAQAFATRWIDRNAPERSSC